MINQIKKVFHLIYFIFFTISCSKFTKIPFIKDIHSQLCNEWLNIIPISYKNIFNSIVYQSGDFITTDKIDIITYNHMNPVDSFIISSIIKKNTSKNIHPIVKQNLTKLPFIGSFSPAFIVINNNLEKDIEIIKKFIEKVDDCIIICPEETIFNKKNIKSQEFSNINKKYNNLLYPRMEGLNLLINELNKTNKLGNLIDLTIKVNDKFKFKTGYLDYFKSKLGDVYCNINSYNINNKCFDNYDNFKTWYLMVWDIKDNYLNNYNSYDYINKKQKINTSTFILNIIFFSLLISNLNLKLNLKNISLIKKKL